MFAVWIASSPRAAYLSGFMIAEALALLGVLVAGRAGAPAAVIGAPAPELAGRHAGG